MAYATRFRMELFGDDGLVHRLDIEEDEYAGGVTSLKPGDNALQFYGGEYNRSDLTSPHFPTWLEFTVYNNLGEASDGVLEIIFGREFGDFRASYYRYEDGQSPALEWRGIVQNDFYEDQPYVPADQLRLEVHDGLSILDGERLPPAASTSMNELHRIACRCLEPLGDDLPLNVIQKWQPHLSNPHASSVQPWEYLLSSYLNWYHDREEDEPEEPMSRREVLLALCNRFNATVRMSGGAWWIIQRDALGDSTVRRHQYDIGTRSLITNGLIDLRASLDGVGSVIRDMRTFDQHAVSVASETVYDGAENFVVNPSFEDALDVWSTSTPNETVAERITYDSSPLSIESTQEDTWLMHLDAPGTETTTVPSLEQVLPARIHPRSRRTFLNIAWDVAIADVGPAGDFTQPRLEVEADGFYLESVRIEVQQDAKAAEDGTLFIEPIEPSGTGVIVPAGQVLPIIEANEQIGEIELSEPARAGDTVLRGRIPERIELDTLSVNVQYWRWTTTATVMDGGFALQSHPIATHQMTPQSISVPLRTPSGTLVTGQPRIRFSIDFTLSIINELWVDHVRMRFESEERTLNTYTTRALLDGLGNSLAVSHRIGDGVTESDRARLAAEGTGGAVDHLTGDWSASGNSETGLTIDQLHARQGLRQRRRVPGQEGQARRNVVLPLKHNDLALSPHHTPDYEGIHTVAYFRLAPSENTCEMQLQPLQDGGASGISYAFSQPTDEAASATGSAREQVLLVEGAEGGGGPVEWEDVLNKPAGILSTSGQGGTTLFTDDVIIDALGYDPIDRFVDAAGDLMTGPLAWDDGDSGGGVIQPLEDGLTVTRRDEATAGRLRAGPIETAAGLLRMTSEATGPDDWAGVFAYRGDSEPGKALGWSETSDRMGSFDISYDGAGDPQIETATFRTFAQRETDETISGHWTYTQEITSDPGLGASAYAVQAFGGSGHFIGELNGRGTIYAEEIVGERIRSAEFLAQQVRAVGGSRAVTDEATIEGVTDDGGGSYTLTTEHEHTFALNDLIWARRYTNGEHESKMTITAVPDNNTFTATLDEGDPPERGFIYIRSGNTTNTDRQALIYDTSTDTRSPVRDYFDGLDSHDALNDPTKRSVSIGRLDGLATPDFGTLSGVGAYLGENVYISSQAVIGGQGLTVDGLTFPLHALFHYDRIDNDPFRSVQPFDSARVRYGAGRFRQAVWPTSSLATNRSVEGESNTFAGAWMTVCENDLSPGVWVSCTWRAHFVAGSSPDDALTALILNRTLSDERVEEVDVTPDSDGLYRYTAQVPSAWSSSDDIRFVIYTGLRGQTSGHEVAYSEIWATYNAGEQPAASVTGGNTGQTVLKYRPSDMNINQNGGFTLAAWVKPDYYNFAQKTGGSTHPNRTVLFSVGINDEPGETSISLLKDAGEVSALRLFNYEDGSASGNTLMSFTDAESRDWMYVLFRFDAATDEAYLDVWTEERGWRSRSLFLDSDLTSFPLADVIYVGGYRWTMDESGFDGSTWGGLIDELIISNYVDDRQPFEDIVSVGQPIHETQQQTTITGGQVQTGRIQSNSGSSWWDLDNDRMRMGSWDWNTNRLWNDSNVPNGSFRIWANNVESSGAFNGSPQGYPTISIRTGADLTERLFVNVGETYSGAWTGRIGFSLSHGKDDDAFMEFGVDPTDTSQRLAQIASWRFTRTEFIAQNDSVIRNNGETWRIENDGFWVDFVNISLGNFSPARAYEMNDVGYIYGERLLASPPEDGHRRIVIEALSSGGISSSLEIQTDVVRLTSPISSSDIPSAPANGAVFWVQEDSGLEQFQVRFSDGTTKTIVTNA